MGSRKCEKLLEKARANPGGLRFTELCDLAECYDWLFARQNGSHHVYKRAGIKQAMNFQEGRNGEAKSYQVKQLLDAIDEYPLDDEEA